MTKKCFKCQIEKPLTDFWITKGVPYSNCKDCANASRNEWYRTDRGRAHQHKQHLLPSKRYALAKYTAKKRRLDFTVTREQFAQLLIAPCAYCGAVIDKTGAGMDRMDNTKGYLIDNVVACCGVCNAVKGDIFTCEEMLRLGQVITEIRRQRSLRISRCGRPVKPPQTQSLRSNPVPDQA